MVDPQPHKTDAPYEARRCAESSGASWTRSPTLRWVWEDLGSKLTVLVQGFRREP